MKMILALAAAAMLTAPSLAAPCRDAKGKFMKCPPAAAMPAGVTKDKTGHCHVAAGPKKGQFTSCPK